MIPCSFSGFSSDFFSANNFPRSFKLGRSDFSSASEGESLSFLNCSWGVSSRGGLYGFCSALKRAASGL